MVFKKGCGKVKNHWADNEESRKIVAKKLSKWRTGKKLSKETKRKIGEKSKNNPCHKKPERCKKISNALKGRKISKEWRRKLSEARKGKKYPKISKAKKEYYIKYPEKHPNRIMAMSKRIGRGHISKGQWNLYYKLKKKYPDAVINFPVRTNKTIRYIDVGIPSLKKGYEYDGIAWHKDKEKDLRRDIELQEMGWKIVHVEGD